MTGGERGEGELEGKEEEIGEVGGEFGVKLETLGHGGWRVVEELQEKSGGGRGSGNGDQVAVDVQFGVQSPGPL